MPKGRFGGRRRGSGRALRGEAGQGLGYVLVVSTVLFILLMAVFDVVFHDMKIVGLFPKKAALLHSADAAVDRALAALQLGGNWDALPSGAVSGYLTDVVYHDIPGIRYTIRVEEGNTTPGYNIGDLEAERTITVFATNTITGERKKIQAVVMLSTINSALFSGGQITIGGSADIHWGPVVSYSEQSDSIPLGGTVPDHPIFISKGGITLGGTPASMLGKDCGSPTPGPSGCVNEKATEIGDPPVVPVDDFRSIAAAQGLLYGGTAGIPPACVDINTSSFPPTTEDTVLFYDTCKGINFDPTIHTQCGGGCSGNAIGAYVKTTGGACGKGILVVMGDLETKGTGCSMSITMKAPTDCLGKYDIVPAGCQDVPNPTLLWDGFIYVAGALKSSGNKKIYGSIYAYDTAGVSGNFAVWYKSANKNMGYLGKTLITKIWMERRPGPADVFPE